MENSLGAGCVAVFAVSGSVLLLSLRAHKHLMSDFMNKIETQMGTGAAKDLEKKKVKFSDDVVELSLPENVDNDGHVRHVQPAAGRNCAAVGGESLESMPENWQVLYRGIIKYNKGLGLGWQN